MHARLKHPLPFAAWWPLAAGALAGVALRLVFSGRDHGLLAPMSWAFIYLAPMAVGAVTVYVAERRRRRSYAYYFWAPVTANLLFVAGTLAILIEGWICAIVVMPLFAFLGAVGGAIMGAICRRTNWPRQAACIFAVVPLVFGILPVERSAEGRVGTVERTVVIDAPAASIWRQIHDVRDIRPEEVEHGWIYRIGVPLPIAGVTQRTPSGLVRRITMGRNVHFDQVVAQWSADRHVRWTYRFDDDSFPSGALDDHVRIGGRYFDLLDTEYTLTPVDDHATSLAISVRYRVTTDFDWYADAVARLLIGNFEETILGFYGRRATSAPGTANPAGGT